MNFQEEKIVLFNYFSLVTVLPLNVVLEFMPKNFVSCMHDDDKKINNYHSIQNFESYNNRETVIVYSYKDYDEVTSLFDYGIKKLDELAASEIEKNDVDEFEIESFVYNVSFLVEIDKSRFTTLTQYCNYSFAKINFDILKFSDVYLCGPVFLTMLKVDECVQEMNILENDIVSSRFLLEPNLKKEVLQKQTFFSHTKFLQDNFISFNFILFIPHEITLNTNCDTLLRSEKHDRGTDCGVYFALCFDEFSKILSQTINFFETVTIFENEQLKPNIVCMTVKLSLKNHNVKKYQDFIFKFGEIVQSSKDVNSIPLSCYEHYYKELKIQQNSIYTNIYAALNMLCSTIFYLDVPYSLARCNSISVNKISEIEKLFQNYREYVTAYISYDDINHFKKLL